MQQDVVAHADGWKSDTGDTGHAAVQGIYFDIDKAVATRIRVHLSVNPTINTRLSRLLPESRYRALSGVEWVKSWNNR